MKKNILVIALFLIGYAVNAQVGIGNTDPNASLDISATNVATPSNTDGILIPRVDEFPVINPTAAQNGMMVFVTGNGTPTKGFYYWNNAGSSWDTFAGSSDADWYEETTTTAPTTNSADIFTDGNVGIGTNSVNYPLDVETPTAGRTINLLNENNGSSVTGVYNRINESSAAASGSANGILNNITRSNQSSISGVSNTFQNSTVNSGFAYLFGYENSFGTSTSNITHALINRFQGTTNSAYGVSNLIGGTLTNFYGVDNHNLPGAGPSGNFYGLYNFLTEGSSGERYGVYTYLSDSGAGNKYGEFINIPNTAGGVHHGIYSDVQKANSFAGYFIGRTSFGNGTTNRYLMPAADGTNGQVMTTNGSGTISFQDPTGGDADWYVESTTTTPSGITDNIYTQGNVEIDQGILTLDPIDDQSGGLTLSKNVSNNTAFTYRNIEATTNITGSTNVWQMQSSFSGNGTGSRASYISRFNGTGNATTTGLLNLFNNDNAASMTGVSNQFLNTSNGVKTGMLNSFNLTAQSSIAYGVRNSFVGGTGDIYGHFTTITDGSSNQYGSNIILTDGTGTRYGNRVSMSGTGGGLDYGVYSDVEDVANGFAGYFQGRFSLGNTGSNRYIMPATDGTNGQVMTTDGSGNVTFQDVSGGDADWFGEGTTAAPNAISDDIFTQGNVAIGKNTADHRLDIELTGAVASPILTNMVDNSTGAGDHTGLQQTMGGAHNQTVKGIETFITNTGNGLHTAFTASVQNGGGNQIGMRNTVSGFFGDNTLYSGDIFSVSSTTTNTQTGLNIGIAQATSQITYGIFSSLNAGGSGSTGIKYGFYNLIDGGFGTHYGVYNDVRGNSNNTKYGTYNLFGIGTTNTGGILYGTYNAFGNSITSTTDKYGTYTAIPSGLGGTHYGTYSDVRNASGFAAYFIGRTSLGNSTSNRYIMPAADGTNGQVMTTDGAGNVTFQTLAGDTDWTTVGANIERQSGNVYIGDTNTTDNDLFISDRIFDWDNTSYYLNPDDTSVMDEIQFDNGSAFDPSVRFSDADTGFYSPSTGVVSFAGNSSERFRIQNDGEIQYRTTTATNYDFTSLGVFPNDGISVGSSLSSLPIVNGYIANDARDNILRLDVQSTNSSFDHATVYATNNIGGTTARLTYNDGTFTGRYAVYADGGTGYAGYFIGNNYISNKLGVGTGAENPDGFVEVRANNSGTQPNLNLIDIGTSGARINFSNTGTTNGNVWTFFGDTDNTTASSRFNLFHTTTGNILQVTGNGNLGILRAPTTNRLEVNGNASKSTAGDWLANSDRRLKKNIETIDSKSALDRITSLRGVTYEWNDKQTGNERPEGVQYGFIAQELIEVFPENVSKDNLGFYQTAYGTYDALYVQAFKEQQKQIKTLQNENKKLQEKLAQFESLEARLSALENGSNTPEAETVMAEKK